MSTVNGFQVGNQTLKYNYESLDNYNTPTFSSSASTSYAVGDYVIYNGKLYKCTTATTGGTWDSTKWATAVLSDDVSDLKSALNGKIVMESGTWSEADPVSKVSAGSRIRSSDKIKVDSFESITFPTGYTGYGSVMDSTGHRLGFTSGYVSTITQTMIRTRYGSNADTFVIVVRNDSTPNTNISSQVSAVMEGTVTKWIEPIKNNGSISDHISQTTDIDAITKEGIWYASNPNTLINVPQSFVGSAFILEVLTEGEVTIQKIKNIQFGNVAVRYKVSGDSWSAWANSTEFIQITSTNAESVYNSLVENIPCNVFGYITTAWFTDMQSIGTNVFGWIFTYARVLTSTNLILQVFVGAYSNQVFTRAKRDNTWTDWQPINRPTADRSAKYFAFGDSTTYGQIGGGTGQSKYNYPNCVGKILDIPVINKAVTNQGLIKDWETIHTNYITNLDMTGAKLITIGWAYNDYSYYSSMNFGAYTDTGDSTFIGKYYTIMKEFQQKCPDAQIVLVTGYGYSNGRTDPVTKPTLTDQFTHVYPFADGGKTTKQMYDALEEMCHLHGWSCVNQSKGTVFNQWNASLLIGDQIHPTNDGYLRYGNYLGARIASLYANIRAW